MTSYEWSVDEDEGESIFIYNRNESNDNNIVNNGSGAPKKKFK